MIDKRKNLILILLKVTISVLILVVIFVKVDFQKIIDKLQSFPFIWTLASIFLIMISITIASLRWFFIIRNSDHHMSFFELLRYNFIGHMFGNILPFSSVSGDAVRGGLVYLAGLSKSQAIKSILIDRLLGLMVLFFLTIVGLPFVDNIFQNKIDIGIYVLFISTATISMLYLIKIFVRHKKYRHIRLISFVCETVEELKEILRISGFFVQIVTISVTAQISAFIALWCIFQGIGSPLPLITLIVIVTPALILASLPISIGGWGVREGAFVATFALISIDPAVAMLASILYGIFNLVASTLGGLAALYIGKKKIFLEKKFL